MGYTLQLPVTEKFLSTQSELKDQVAILLGGRVAEEIVFGDISSGAQNDLERATEIARAMVTRLGMSESLGPLTYGKQQRLMYLGMEGAEDKNYSEETARLIDAELRALVEEGHGRAKEILIRKRQDLNAIAARLLEKEVIGREELAQLLRAGSRPMVAE